jgi:hypothetical protein
MKIRALGALTAAAALLLAIPGPAQAAGTWVWSNPIAHVYQDTPYNCLPAAAQNMLASAGYTVSQDTLSREFGTVEKPGGGTYWTKAVGPLDQIVAGGFKTFDQRYVASPAALMNEAEYSIGTYRTAVMASVVDGQLPWVRDRSDIIGHFVAVYGYNAAQNAVYVWDPEPGRGYERAWISDLYGALQSLNDPYTGASSAHAVYEIEER